jgi:putative FmdB family regulatory protein
MYNATLFILLVTILSAGKRSMPIYEYLCETCGHQQEALQKISDKPLTDCEACQQPTLKKMISAAGFRLSGSGWYETDFKSSHKKNLTGDSNSDN